MRAALIGLPYSGKSTVFKALTGLEIGKKEETIGTIKVPDSRIDELSKLYKPKKTTYAEFVLSDFNVPASKEALIPPKIKNMIQKTDMLIYVLRNFDSMMTADAKDPLKEYQSMKEEMLLADFIVIERRLEREKKEKKNPPELKILKKMHESLENGSVISPKDMSADELQLVANYNFLTLKNSIVLINQDEGVADIPDELEKALAQDNCAYFSVSATLENELADLTPEEQKEFLEGFGLTETAKERFVQNAYRSMGLISFLTAGEDEVRAWPIHDGDSALIAAGKIHSDIARGFIRAETIDFETFMKYGSESECKKDGVFRLEGKEYRVKDGDIINFRFNV